MKAQNRRNGAPQGALLFIRKRLSAPRPLIKLRAGRRRRRVLVCTASFSHGEKVVAERPDEGLLSF